MMEFTPLVIFAAIASGAIIGVFLGTFGGGGSVLAAPLLLYVVGVTDPHMAIGTSAAAVAAIALFSLIGPWRHGEMAVRDRVCPVRFCRVDHRVDNCKTDRWQPAIAGLFGRHGGDRTVNVPQAGLRG